MEISNAPRPGIQSELNPIADAHPGYQINDVIYRGRGGIPRCAVKQSSTKNVAGAGAGRGVWDVRYREHLICHNCRMKICNKQLNSVDVVDGRMSTDCREPRKRRFCCWLWSSRLSPSSSCSPLSISLCLPRFSAVQNARRPAPGARLRLSSLPHQRNIKDGRRCARAPAAFLRYEQNIKL